MLICEALKGNKTLQSLFVDANGICTEGAHALSDLLLDKRSGLLELHVAWNLISIPGLNSLFIALALTNRKLKFLDVSYNFIEIAVIHSLRQMIEKNKVLKYLSISDLYKFNERATGALIQSM